jgi:hypothetical protein
MSHRRRALVLLLILGFASLAGAAAVDGCEDACEPDCGDCLGCPLLAELPAAPRDSGPGASGTPFAEAQPDPSPPPGRPHDHVPLAAA